MQPKPLTADAFMALVESHVKAGGKRRGLGPVNSAAPGFWMNGKAFAHLIPLAGTGLHLYLHRLRASDAMKILEPLDATADDARDVADRIVLHLTAA